VRSAQVRSAQAHSAQRTGYDHPVPRVAIAPLIRVTRDGSRTDQDLVAVEAPLSIEVVYGGGAASLGLFLRTPGDDDALALGLLYAEGVIRRAGDVAGTAVTLDADDASATLRVTLAPAVAFDPAALARSGVASTACGLCGRLAAARPDVIRADAGRQALAPDVIFQLPDRLRDAQAVFAKTGGLHAAAFVDHEGRVVDLAEDVGRHNAVDKLVGRALLAGHHPPAGAHALLVSGRVAYEIVQKAAMAGVRTLVAIGAPTSLAVQAARDSGITLIGFAKDGSYNVYG
jgi:FdhD protein